MSRFHARCGLSLCGLALAIGCGRSGHDAPPDGAVDAAPSQNPITIVYDFSQGDHGWQPVFSDFTPDQAATMALESGLRSFPPEPQKTAFFVQSHNRSDDAFMLLHGRIGTAQGVVPGARYKVSLAIVMASDAPRGCTGVGGAPGEGVTLKIGAANHEPRVVVPTDASGLYLVTVDKGNQATGGADMSVAGDIANNADASECTQHVFHAFSRVHQHARPVTATADGDLWLLVGSDSGYEGLTQLYYQRVDVTLTPVM